MNWVDLLVVLLALLAAASGARSGLVIALFSFLGVFVGAVIALKVTPPLLVYVNGGAARIALGVGLVVLLVALGETFGMWAGRELRDRLVSTRLTGVDNVLGAVLQGAAVFVVAWLVALPFTAATAVPGLASAISRSAVLSEVDSVMPASARQLPNELRSMLGASGFPDVLEPFSPAPAQPVQPPDPNLGSNGSAQDAQPSVVKVRGQAPSCSRSLEGTGFVVAPHRVVTNAHVVAGTDQASTETAHGRLEATVVFYDPKTDIAVLSVPDLDAPPLRIAPDPVGPGQDVIALGYPLDGPYTAEPGRVRERVNLRGPDIYDTSSVVRDVYTVRGKVQSGNSGGPLVEPDGEVVGVVFGAAVDNPDTGFALTAQQVAGDLAQASGRESPVSTGQCAG